MAVGNGQLYKLETSSCTEPSICQGLLLGFAVLAQDVVVVGWGEEPSNDNQFGVLFLQGLPCIVEILDVANVNGAERACAEQHYWLPGVAISGQALKVPLQLLEVVQQLGQLGNEGTHCLFEPWLTKQLQKRLAI